MKDTIINLTPPIDGVQYGISDEPIKKGDVFLCPVGNLFEIKQTPMDLHNPEYKKLILSTNPKDIRFPYLQPPSKEDYSNWKPVNGEQVWVKVFSNWSSGTYIGLDEDKIHYLIREPKEGGGHIFKSKEILPLNANPNKLPSKEQEVDKYALLAAKKKYLLSSANEPCITCKDALELMDKCLTNKGIYTQEQMEKAIFQAKLGTQLTVTERYSGEDGVDNLTKDILQSLQPTAKAVRVEMEEKCARCYSTNKNECWSAKECSDGKYDLIQIKVEQSTEYSQGIVRAIEVIY